MFNPKKLVAAAVMALTAATVSAQATQGVSANEIVIGSIQDLSGPLAGYGRDLRNGMTMAVDEINERGGINGRKFRVIFEDSAYDPRKAALAAQSGPHPPHAEWLGRGNRPCHSSCQR